MTRLENIRPNALLKRIREHRATSLPLIAILLFGTAALLLIALSLWPNWRQRQTFIDQVSVEQNLIEHQSQLPLPDKAALDRQLSTLRHELVTAQESFVGEKEIDALLSRLYTSAALGGVTVDTLQAQTTLDAEGEQLPQIVFRLSASGYSTQLLNFVARIERASAPGLELDDLSLLPDGETGLSVLVMDLHFHTSPQFLETPTPIPTPATGEPIEAETATPTPDPLTSEE